MAQTGKGRGGWSGLMDNKKKPHCTSTVRLKNSFIITKTKNLLIRSPLQAIGDKVRVLSENYTTACKDFIQRLAVFCPSLALGFASALLASFCQPQINGDSQVMCNLMRTVLLVNVPTIFALTVRNIHRLFLT